MLFDIVISSIEKDKYILQHTIQSIKKYVKDYRRIIVVSNNKLTDIEGVEWFDEKLYPFTKKDIYDNLCNFGSRRNIKCSYINQVLKLYAHKVIPNLTENILICDSDIVFIKDVTFIENGIPLYGNRVVPSEWDVPYNNHYKLLHDTFNFIDTDEQKKLLKSGRINSGICHHIMYNKYIIDKLIDKVEKQHNKTFWKYYFNIADENSGIDPANCGLYYDYICKFHKDKMKIRPITWMESAAPDGSANPIINNFNETFENQKRSALNNGNSYCLLYTSPSPRD